VRAGRNHPPPRPRPRPRARPLTLPALCRRRPRLERLAELISDPPAPLRPLTPEEARLAAGAAAAAAAATAALLVRRRRRRLAASGAAPDLEIASLEDLLLCDKARALRTVFAALAPPRVTAVRVRDAGAALPSLPRALLSLPLLRHLDVSGAALGALPPRLGRLAPSLRSLDVARCGLAALPDSLTALTALTSLNAADNALTALPAGIGALTALVRLGLRGNRLEALPPSVGRLAALRELYLTDNALAALPEELAGCAALAKLQASHNAPLAALPAALGRLPRLELLRLARCGLTNDALAPLAAAPALAWVSLAGNPCAAPAGSSSRLPLVDASELELGAPLGAGASGEVRAGAWRGRRVAVKLFPPADGGAPKSPDGAPGDEAAVAAALAAASPRLPRVVAALRPGAAAPGGGLVMELAPGAPLAAKPTSGSLLRCLWPPGAAFDARFVLAVAADVAAALEAMHGRGVVHGDVYAHNVLADGDGRATLVDYGAAGFAPRGGAPAAAAAAALEGADARAFGLLLRDLVARLEISFERMDAELDAQKQLLALAAQCCGGPAGARPRLGAVARRLRSLEKAAEKGLRGSATATPRSDRTGARPPAAAPAGAATAR
jgi:hypothetical protein